MADDNKCQAEVKFLNVTAAGNGAKFSFNVKTKCERSEGRFDYSFTDAQTGRLVERRSPWSGIRGKDFLWTDEFAIPAAAVKDVRIESGSIRSTKV